MAGAGPPDGVAAPREVVLAHVTDLHFGRDDPGTVEPLIAALNAIAPQVVVVGGDLTHRSRAGQFRRSRAFLDGLDAPWLAVPGNHDVPLYNLLRRVLLPTGRFRRMVTGDRAPLFAAPGLRVLGLDSTRRKVTGRLKRDRIAQIARLAEGDPADLRVLVTHHPLVRKPLEGAGPALAAARAAGVDVLLAGHHHHFHLKAYDGVVAIESASPSHRLEPTKGFSVVRATATTVETERHVWDGRAFVAHQPRAFPRRNPAPTRQ